MKTNLELVKYVESKIGCPYWYGATGQIGTQAFLDILTKQEWTKKYHTPELNEICKKGIGKQVFDCVGLIKSFEFNVNAETGKGVYVAEKDVSANGMRTKFCSKQGTIDSIPEIPGLLVFKEGHVGIYVGNGKVVEAKGTKYGVVKSNLKDTKWLYWGQCDWFEYTQVHASSVINVGDTVAIKASAVRYANKEQFVIPNKLKGKPFTAQCYYGGNKNIMVLKEINSPVAISDLELYSESVVVKEINIGDKVNIKTSAEFYACTPQKEIPTWVKNKTWTVWKYYNNRKDVVVLKEINSPIALKDLQHA